MNQDERIRLRRFALVSLIALVVILVIGAVSNLTSVSPNHRSASLSRAGRIPAELGLEDDPDAQMEMEFLMQRDPVTNTIPIDIHRREVAFARRLPRGDALRLMRSEGNAAAQALVWTERGPNNVGGRTRAFGIDVANPTTLLAGGVAGGMWKSTDDGASWTSRMAPGQMHSSTCVTQDKRAGQTGTWYAGTGEIRGSTTNDTRWGSLYRGDGIFKSTDNGDSWTLLPSTASGTPQSSDNFDWVLNVATDPSNLAQDEVYAATHNGIYRSTDGGTSWTQTLASDSSITEIAVTPTGVAYAFTHNAGAVRIWRSPDGVTWTNILPVGFPTAVNRVVVGLAPSNVNSVYFFCQGVNTSPQVAGHQLWKYTYVSGNGSGAGGTWTNRGGNLPVDLNTQTGYDINIHVKPNDENFVIIGGTNLYRSTDGFASSLNTTTIGGYPFYPDFNHHPDQHSGGFVPSNPTVFYSSNDGGVAKAADITLANMVWTSLDHGYNVTQLYSVSIAPEAGSNMILAGAQDNGSWLGNAPGASDWTMAYGGDGTVVEVAPIADDRLYTQWQGGNIQRQNRDGTNVIDFTPAGAANLLFVNPIVLDPNNSQLLYYGGGVSATTSRIWRNDNAPTATSSTGWTNLPATEVGAGSGYSRRITAMGISTAANPNVLYYGTVDGLVFRADNANTATPTVTNITPPGLAGGNAWGGFVRCIAVDPTNSSKALLVFGNYNFQSLWYTTNGGANWTDVEGNLAGPSGPSCRWATMFYVDGGLQVFLGTSIGVLSTTALAGGSTVWAQEGTTSMGNIIVGYMDYRASDRTLAIGTHSRGVFTTVIPSVAGVGDLPLAAHERMLAPSYPNPARRSATIAYRLPRADDVSLRVYDVAGREVANLVNARQDAGPHEAGFAAGTLASGTYLVVLQTNGRTESTKLSLTR